MAPEPARERSLRLTSSVSPDSNSKLPEPLAKPADGVAADLGRRPMARRAAGRRCAWPWGRCCAARSPWSRMRAGSKLGRAARRFRRGRARVQRRPNRQCGRRHRAAGSGRLAASSAHPCQGRQAAVDVICTPPNSRWARSIISGCRSSTSRSSWPQSDGGWRIALGGPERGGLHIAARRRSIRPSPGASSSSGSNSSTRASGETPAADGVERDAGRSARSAGHQFSRGAS